VGAEGDWDILTYVLKKKKKRYIPSGIKKITTFEKERVRQKNGEKKKKRETW